MPRRRLCNELQVLLKTLLPHVHPGFLHNFCASPAIIQHKPKSDMGGPPGLLPLDCLLHVATNGTRWLSRTCLIPFCGHILQFCSRQHQSAPLLQTHVPPAADPVRTIPVWKEIWKLFHPKGRFPHFQWLSTSRYDDSSLLRPGRIADMLLQRIYKTLLSHFLGQFLQLDNFVSTLSTVCGCCQFLDQTVHSDRQILYQIQGASIRCMNWLRNIGSGHRLLHPFLCQLLLGFLR